MLRQMQIITAFMENSVAAPQKAKGRVMMEISNPTCAQSNELKTVCYMPMFTAVLFTKANMQDYHLSPDRSTRKY